MPGAAPPGCSLGRWLLLVVVLVGLSGMHVLTAEDAAGGHGMLPATITAHSMTGHDAPGAPTMADQQMVADPVGMVSAPGPSSIPAAVGPTARHRSSCSTVRAAPGTTA